MGSLILSRCVEQYPDKINATFNMVPSPRVQFSVLEPYN